MKEKGAKETLRGKGAGVVGLVWWDNAKSTAGSKKCFVVHT